jgi:hypothetical protein
MATTAGQMFNICRVLKAYLVMLNHIKQGPSNIQLGILGSTEIAISQKKHSIHFPIRF